ncbi:CBS domain-containing protein [Haloferula chungangensis]|uniref:CBS domain-containing protein n=1 Tax=Haloferula chungangensis TaxID=1048331 RepID=A0ABW2L6X7_9BACT
MKSNVLNQDVMLPLDRFPVVSSKFYLKQALEEMTRHTFGIACVTDEGGKLLGIFTDGDMRRLTLRQQKPWSALFVDDIMDHSTKNPVTVSPEMPLVEAVKLMEQKHIWDLPVVDADGKLVGLLHLHQAIKHLLGI